MHLEIIEIKLSNSYIIKCVIHLVQAVRIINKVFSILQTDMN